MTEIGRVNKHKTTHQDGGDDEVVLTGILPGVHKTTHQDGGDDELDLTGITPGAHKTTHQDAGADEIDATGLAGRCDFVDRGDPASADFTQANLTTKEAWTDMDLSSILPAGTKAVLLHVTMYEDTVSAVLAFRKNGISNTINSSRLYVSVSEMWVSGDLVVFVDSNRIIEYYLDNVAYDYIRITVGGWWI